MIRAGLDYFLEDRVGDLAFDPEVNSVSAIVEGSGRNSYVTTIIFDPDLPEDLAESDCTCPVAMAARMPQLCSMRCAGSARLRVQASGSRLRPQCHLRFRGLWANGSKASPSIISLRALPGINYVLSSNRRELSDRRSVPKAPRPRRELSHPVSSFRSVRGNAVHRVGIGRSYSPICCNTDPPISNRVACASSRE